jgi:hypothetical protein
MALSTITAFALLVGYAGVQWMEGNWQPSALDSQPATTSTATTPTSQQPLVLQPTVPSGAVTTGWETPIEDESIDTAAKEREIR